MAYSTIPKPSLYFNTKLISGNGGTQSLTGVGFKPDFTWIKSRSRVDPHSLTDIVRGVASQLDSSGTLLHHLIVMGFLLVLKLM